MQFLKVAENFHSDIILDLLPDKHGHIKLNIRQDKSGQQNTAIKKSNPSQSVDIPGHKIFVNTYLHRDR